MLNDAADDAAKEGDSADRNRVCEDPSGPPVRVRARSWETFGARRQGGIAEYQFQIWGADGEGPLRGDSHPFWATP